MITASEAAEIAKYPELTKIMSHINDRIIEGARAGTFKRTLVVQNSSVQDPPLMMRMITFELYRHGYEVQSQSEGSATTFVISWRKQEAKPS